MWGHLWPAMKERVKRTLIKLSLNWRFVILGDHTEKINFSNSLFRLMKRPSSFDMKSLIDLMLSIGNIWSIDSVSMIIWKLMFCNTSWIFPIESRIFCWFCSTLASLSDVHWAESCWSFPFRRRVTKLSTSTYLGRGELSCIGLIIAQTTIKKLCIQSITSVPFEQHYYVKQA